MSVYRTERSMYLWKDSECVYDCVSPGASLCSRRILGFVDAKK